MPALHGVQLQKEMQSNQTSMHPTRKLFVMKKMNNPRWHPRISCDDRLMAKTLMVTIHDRGEFLSSSPHFTRIWHQACFCLKFCP